MPPETPKKKLNNEIFHRVLVYVLCGLLGLCGLWVRSRASADDVKRNEDAIKEHAEKADRRLRSVEVNVIKMCQLLDRQDRKAGGQGIRCQDPR